MKLTIALLSLCLVAGCSADTKANDRDTMTQRQKDSVFGQSGLPGASAITKAQTAADSLDAQRRRADSAARADTGVIR